MKKKIQLLLLAILIFASAGCTTYLKQDNKNIIYEATGQTLASNILCQPDSQELYDFYAQYDDSLSVKLEDLPTCAEFKPSDLKYQNIWESILVKPIAWLILKIGLFLGNYGLSVMVMSLIIRALMIPLTKKSQDQSNNMKKAQPEIEKIERKYHNRDDNDSLMAKSQETMMVYKKYNINPVMGCLTAFIQLPLFFAFLEAINRVPAIFEGNLFNMNLGMTPIVGLQQQNFIYIILVIVIIATTYLSFKISMNTQVMGDNASQMKLMMAMMLVMISFASFSLPTAIALYWVVNNIFAIVQSLITNKLNERRK
jgi:YidC/Oxa1 family membrane protein insertase